MKKTSSTNFTEKQKKKKATGTSSVALRVWSKQAVFKKYLKSLNSCDRFLNEKNARWLLRIGSSRRKRIEKRLKEVDPEGYEKVISMTRSITHKRIEARKRKKLHTNEITQKALERELIALANSAPPEENHGVETFKYVQADTVLEMIASLMASGYTKDEIAKRTSFSTDLINAVTPDHVKAVKRLIPNAIVDALEQKVYRDLIDTGAVTQEMERADRMISRRRKNYLDATKVASEVQKNQGLRKLDSKVLNDRHKSRFGAINEERDNDEDSSSE